MHLFTDKLTNYAVFIIFLLAFFINHDIVKSQNAPFITTWKTTEPNEEIIIPAGHNSEFPDFDFEIDWGDGTVEKFEGHVGKLRHSYDVPDNYIVKITGIFPHLRMIATDFPFDRMEVENAAKLQTIEQWGDIEWESMERAFMKAENMTYNATDVPDLSKVKNMNLMFGGASNFNGNLSSWEVGNVTKMESVFTKAESFNGDLSNWDVSNVSTMVGMFFNANSFKSDLSNWDVSNVTNMNVMFHSAQSFNADLSNWEVSNVTDMRGMFKGAKTFNTDLNSWDVSNVTNMKGMFENANSFNRDLNSWDVSKVTTLANMFHKAKSFNGNLGDWDVSNVTTMAGMFSGAESFNRDLSNWDVSNVKNFTHNFNGGFLTGVELSPEKYDALLIGWSKLDLQPELKFDAGHSSFSKNGKEARQKIIDKFNWSISDEGLVPEPGNIPFITTWETTSENEKVIILTSGGSDIANFDFQIDWGDGTVEDITGDDPDPNHTYAEAGTYTVEITGVFPFMRMPLTIFAKRSDYDANPRQLNSIEQWGDIVWESMEYMFKGATNMTYNASDIPNISRVISMAGMFRNARSFNGDISNWDVSNVKDMRNMFRNSRSFNGDLNGWNVSKVTMMSAMFKNAMSFDKDLTGWNVSSVTDMRQMFEDAEAFNGDLSDWDVSNVTTMYRMFNGAKSFNGDLSSWDVAKVNNMKAMFFGAKSFNSDISNWDVRNVNNLTAMFSKAGSFNSDLKNWNVSNVTYMDFMFANAKSFNGNLRDWDVSNVLFMIGMFMDANSFNRDLSNWNVSNVIDMGGMFTNAESFNRDLSSWDVSNVSTFNRHTGGFLEGTRLSRQNYDALLLGWSELELQTNVEFNVGNSEFSEAADEARQKIIDEYNWTIVDGGKAESTDIEDRTENIPEEFTLKQNYPNPFNPTTTIEYGLPKAAEVQLTVYNLMGKEIATLVQERQAAGRHSVNFDAASLSSGMYLYRIEARDFSQTRKLILVK